MHKNLSNEPDDRLDLFHLRAETALKREVERLKRTDAAFAKALSWALHVEDEIERRKGSPPC